MIDNNLTYDLIFAARPDVNVACCHLLEMKFVPVCLSLSPPRSSQVHLLRTAGDEVTVTVRYLREVPSFLKLPLGERKLTVNSTAPSAGKGSVTPRWEIVFLALRRLIAAR